MKFTWELGDLRVGRRAKPLGKDQEEIMIGYSHYVQGANNRLVISLVDGNLLQEKMSDIGLAAWLNQYQYVPVNLE